MPSIVFDGDTRKAQGRRKGSDMPRFNVVKDIPWPLVGICLCLLAAWWIGH